MRKGQPNFFLVFDRLRIDPFTDFFEITLVAEGTVRGTGGVRVVDYDCATDVPGLFAAGDTATRELICGGFTGGGSHNAAWAASSGSWAGSGAAAFATQRGGRPAPLRAIGGAGLRPTERQVGLDYRAVTAAVQRHVLPHETNFLRHADHLRPALQSLHDAWAAVRAGLGAVGEDVFRAREAAAMVAHSRWMYHAALQRTESRGMHKRVDFPAQDPAQRHRLLTGGLDELWSHQESGRAAPTSRGGRAA
ncbi:hypothetical protein BH09ACT7_BH09ACT7_07980 [soil metagenome]